MNFNVKEWHTEHCKDDPMYVFPERKLRGLVPNFHIHESLYNSLTETWMWKLGTRPRSFISGNICSEFSVQFLCSEEWNGTLLTIDTLVDPEFSISHVTDQRAQLFWKHKFSEILRNTQEKTANVIKWETRIFNVYLSRKG